VTSYFINYLLKFKNCLDKQLNTQGGYMRIYRFWLDQLPAVVAEELIADESVTKMWINKQHNTWLVHGDYQQVPDHLRMMNAGSPNYAKSGTTYEPTAVEIADSYDKLDWVLLSTVQA